MTAAVGDFFRWVELIDSSKTRVSLLVRIPMSVHADVDSLCRRRSAHTLQFYRDVFDSALSGALGKQVTSENVGDAEPSLPLIDATEAAM
jgi:hypothetical protein